MSVGRQAGLAGVVRFWLADEGWGVIDSPSTPDGCWAHFSHVEMEGYVTLSAGQRVRFDKEAANQDGYHWRATSVRLDPSDVQ